MARVIVVIAVSLFPGLLAAAAWQVPVWLLASLSRYQAVFAHSKHKPVRLLHKYTEFIQPMSLASPLASVITQAGIRSCRHHQADSRLVKRQVCIRAQAPRISELL